MSERERDVFLFCQPAIFLKTLGGNRITPDTLLKEAGFYPDFQFLLRVQWVRSESYKRSLDPGMLLP